MSKDRPVVAITGLEGRDNPYPGVAIARALRAARGRNVTLVGLAYDPLLTGNFRSDLFDRIYAVPYPSDPPSALRRRLREIHGEFPLDVLIPALDSEMPICAMMSDDLRADGIRTLLPAASSIKARFKERLESFCREHAIACPRTEVVVDPLKFFEGGHWPLPCFIKGCLADAHLVTTVDEAVAAHHRVALKWGYPVLAQEPVHGEEVDICAVVRPGGEPLAMLVMKKIALSRAGKAVGGVILDDPEAEAEARRIILALKWQGPLELELVREASSGRFHMIEINARFPAWVATSAGAGVNLPDLLLRLIMDEPLPAAAAVRAGTVFMRTSRTTISSIDQVGTLAATGRLIHRAADRARPVRPPKSAGAKRAEVERT